MKKWLSLIVMSCILFGAAYVAVATEQGRKVMKKSETAAALLAEIDALLASDNQNPELLNKRAMVVQDLENQGIAVPASEEPVVKDAEYLRSIGMDEAQIDEYLGKTPKSAATETAKVQEAVQVKDDNYYRSNGMLAELDRIEREKAEARDLYLLQLSERRDEGIQLSPAEKLELEASNMFDGGRDENDNLDDIGGPSAIGYRWVDNLNGDTATYSWEEPTAPVELTNISSSDDGAQNFSWGFNFPFFGVNYTAGSPGTNGYIDMTGTTSDFSNECWPSTSTPTGPAVMPFWDDGHAVNGGSTDGGRVVYQVYADHVTITWDSLGVFLGTGDILDYQCQLWNDGKIKFQYRQIFNTPSTGTAGKSPTIGIQQSNGTGGLDHLTYHCSTVMDSAYTNALDGRAIWFYQLFLDNDFSCDAVVEPSPLRLSPGEVFEVIGTFRNAGNITQSAPVSYQFNGGTVVTEATAVLANNQSENHDFAGTETAPVAVGDYELLLWTGLVGDEDTANDTCRVTVQVRECYDEAQTDGFTVNGTTCGALNDWQNTCLGSYDASEDYIYQWTTTTGGAWNIMLTATTSQSRGLVISSSCPPDSFNCIAYQATFQDTMLLSCVPLDAGTYYIMVDRISSCDAYTLTTSPCTEVGRCCYNGGASCTDNGPYDCLQLAGEWTAGYTCTANPCPVQLQGDDLCPGPVLATVPMTVSGTTVGATPETGIPSCGSIYNTSAPGVWYNVVGTGNTMTASLCDPATSFDTELFVFCRTCEDLVCVGGDDDGCVTPGAASTFTWCSAAGNTYYILVTAFSTSTGSYVLSVTDDGVACTGAIDCSPLGRCCYLDAGTPMCVDNLEGECTTLGGQWDDFSNCTDNPCPVGRCCYDGGASCADNTELECIALAGSWNSTLTCTANPCPVVLQGSDECVDAPVLGVGATVEGTTVGYTIDNVALCGTSLNTSPGVWYKVTGNGDSLEATTCNAFTTFDTKIGIFCGACDYLICVGGNDDNCSGFSLRSTIRWASELGRDYYVLVTGFSTNTGDFEISINDLGAYFGTPVNCSLEGRCCYLDAGAPMCADLLFADCDLLGGQFDINLTCATTPCETGRCCYLDNGIASCEDDTELECIALNGIWDVGLSCTTDPCPSGRCCYLDGGAAACLDNTELECLALNGVWDEGLSCTTTPCEVGRCCYDDNGTTMCADNTELECGALAGVWDVTLTCATPCPLILQGSDDCIDATAAGFNQTYFGTCDGYNPETNLPACQIWYSTSLPPAVWYKFIGTGNTVTISLCDALTTYDSEIGVFCGETCETLECVANNDDFCGLQSELSFCSVLGAEYKLLITAFSAFSTPPFNFAFIITDDGTPCTPSVVCPVTATCDPVIDLTAYAIPTVDQADHLQLRFTAPQDADYKVWYSINPNNDGNPDDGADADFVLETTLTGVLQNDVVVFDSTDPWTTFRYYVITADCGGVPILNR